MPTTLKLTPTETVTILASSPELLDVEALYGPGGNAPPPYLHPAQDERFEVLEGTLRACVNGEDRTLNAGDTLAIPRGTKHRMWNPADTPSRVRWQTTPRGRTEEWFGRLDGLQRGGHVGRNGMPGPLAFAVLLTEYRDVFRLAVGPDPIVRVALAGLGMLGRLRGSAPATTAGHTGDAR